MGEGVKRTGDVTHRAGWRAHLWAAAIGVAAVAPALTIATPTQAETPQTSDEAARKLEQEKSALAAKESRSRELQKDVAGIVDERREINARLLETAALVQKSEEQMTAIETRLAGFERQEQAVRASLAKEHGKISGVLAALQRMGRNPPPVIITRREDALEMVRSAMLLGVAFPGLRAQAQALTVKLNELVGIMASIRREGDNLRAERERLTTTQTRLASLLDAKKQSLAERETELRQVRAATAEIAKNVTDLSELIAKLSRQVTAAPVMPAPQPAGDDPVVAVLPPAAQAEPGAEGAPGAAGATIRETAIETVPAEEPPLAPGKKRTKEAIVAPPPKKPPAGKLEEERRQKKLSLEPGAYELRYVMDAPVSGLRVLATRAVSVE